VEDAHPLAVERLLFVPEQVGPLERPELGEFRPLQQGVDQSFALVRRSIVEERPGLVGGRENPDGIEVRAAEKDVIGREPGRCQPQRLQLGEEVLVHRV
jgi:hypothetical protein